MCLLGADTALVPSLAFELIAASEDQAAAVYENGANRGKEAYAQMRSGEDDCGKIPEQRAIYLRKLAGNLFATRAYARKTGC